MIHYGNWLGMARIWQRWSQHVAQSSPKHCSFHHFPFDSVVRDLKLIHFHQQFG